ncbi:MAG: hypothetical protein NVS9B1_07470 [Candidatus Dormibacteraceae bacterium]
MAEAVREPGFMDGEDSDTSYKDDITHWVGVYSQLLEFCEGLLARAQPEGTDVDAIRATRSRLADRLNFWSVRNRR